MNKIFLIVGIFLMFGMSCVLANENLVMSDLEEINLDGLSVQTTESGNLLFRVETYTDTLGIYGHPSPKIDLGEKRIYENAILDYEDMSISEELPTSFRIEFSSDASVQEGDFITLTYDSGQILDVYLPNANVYDYFFVANDGSTYYDADLTELAMARPSIIGPNIVELASTNIYDISISTDLPDSDYSDGTYQVQYANWGLMDSNGNLVFEGNWNEIFGEYKETVSITFPDEVGEYSLFAMITQIDMNFDESTGLWTSSIEVILVQEAIKINVQYSVTEPSVPNPSGFGFFSDIFSWLSGLWNWIF